MRSDESSISTPTAPAGGPSEDGASGGRPLERRSDGQRSDGKRQDVLAPDLRRRNGIPRLAFLGVGWIGHMRMKAVVESGAAAVAAVGDLSDRRLDEIAPEVPHAELFCGAECVDDLIAAEPDGIVIATPNALHATQAIRILKAGIPVFCQKPLGRDGDETRAVVEAAREADRLLGVDFSYRRLRGTCRIRELVRSGAIGRVYSADLVFHNAYGPDKTWFYDGRLSGGGCLMDLGGHLVDLALWTLDFPEVTGVSGRLFAGGRPLRRRRGGRRNAGGALNGTNRESGENRESEGVEDFATARIDLEGGAVASISCSWNLSAGCDAVIEATFHGTDGTLSLRNVDGSFYDFRTEWFKGRETRLLDVPPDPWGGRTLEEWARALRDSPAYDSRIERVIPVADVLDALYSGADTPSRARAPGPGRGG